MVAMSERNMQIYWIIVFLTIVTFSPFGVSACLKRKSSLMQQLVIFGILANYQIAWPIIAFFAINMMRDGSFRHSFAQHLLSYKNMFQNVTRLCRMIMARAINKDISRPIAKPAPLPSWGFRSSLLGIMTTHIFSRSSFNFIAPSVSAVRNFGLSSTPTGTKTQGNQLDRLPIDDDNSVSHDTNLLRRFVDWLGPWEVSQHPCGLLHYNPMAIG
jgi:hypothetical protein